MPKISFFHPWSWRHFLTLPRPLTLFALKSLQVFVKTQSFIPEENLCCSSWGGGGKELFAINCKLHFAKDFAHLSFCTFCYTDPPVRCYFLLNYVLSVLKTDEPMIETPKGQRYKSSAFMMLLYFIHWLMSDSLRSLGLQHAGLPCPSPSRGACPNSCSLNWWCSLSVLSFAAPVSSCLQSCQYWGHESALQDRWPKHWSFSFSIGPSNGCSGFSSFRLAWFDLLAV